MFLFGFFVDDDENQKNAWSTRKIIYGIRVLWYENLKLNLSASNSCQLERIIEPEAFGQSVYGVLITTINGWFIVQAYIHQSQI
jgi:hypothetical protein